MHRPSAPRDWVRFCCIISELPPERFWTYTGWGVLIFFVKHVNIFFFFSSFYFFLTL
jgi:hypothetical protein